MSEVFAGRYVLLDVIGTGGMGSVWRARDLRSGEVVAAKVLQGADAGALLRFVREQAVRVHHPHIVVPLGWAGEDDRVLFTMPIVDGGSVATLVGDFGALPPRFVAEVMRQMLSALDAVHAARLVHRDLKPANILLAATGTGRPHAYLSDFGIAVDLDGPRFTEPGWVTGTPGYLAPELATFGEPTPAADLYSLGMVAATMLTGRRPSAAGDVDVTRARSDPAAAALRALVADLCVSDPAGRPGSAEVSARLSVPELAWTADAVGDIEVFRQLAPLEAEPGDVRASIAPPYAAPPYAAAPRATRPPAAELSGAGPGAAESTPAPVVPTVPARVRTARPGLVRDLVVAGVLATMIVVGAVLLFT